MQTARRLAGLRQQVANSEFEPDRRRLDLFDRHAEMAYAEQAALEGILAVLRPALAIELGTFRGGSLSRIATHSGEVHTFDLVSHTDASIPNVTYHLGDTQSTLPKLLGKLASARRNVDFVLVDADHSRAGVQRDLSNLLSSDALQRTVIVLHDCANEGVREGARRALADAGALAYVDLSFVARVDATPLLSEVWGGLGLIVIDREGDAWPFDPQVLANVRWRTSVPRSLLWRGLAPVRAARRECGYRLRPLYRRIKGSRGVKVG